jgi:hypothetical protein
VTARGENLREPDEKLNLLIAGLGNVRLIDGTIINDD